jgi:CBS-domain-containing membrane protein
LPSCHDLIPEYVVLDLRQARRASCHDRNVNTVDADAPVRDAANLMLKQRISGLPVVDGAGRLIGMVSEGRL